MKGPSEFEQLRDLLVVREATALEALERQLEDLRDRINDPDRLALILRVAITRAFLQGDRELGLAVIKAVAPVLDQAIRQKAAEDPAAMTAALAPVSTGAVALHFATAPEAAAQDLAPLVSASIKRQIRAERESVIDALYPVIGSIIAKYFSEMMTALVRKINEKIEARLSLTTLVRKVRARFLGVSEAELLIREGIPWRVDAAFLIHTASGLLIAQAQAPGTPPLDPDLLSGMLTAIRSLFNESLLKNQPSRELDQIDYGESRIVLETAGFCYLAAVVRGVPDETFGARLRETAASIVQLPGRTIEKYSGEPGSVLPAVNRAVAALVSGPPPGPASGKREKPYAVIAAAFLLLLLIAVPLAIHFYRTAADREMSGRIHAALAASFPAPLERVRVEVEGEAVRLTGATANEAQRARAVRVAMATAPGWTITDLIKPEPEPLFAVLTERRVREVAEALNTMDGVDIDARFAGDNLSVIGSAPDSTVAANIVRTFEGLPGVRTVEYNVNAGPPAIAVRLLFDFNSAALRADDAARLEEVRAIAGRLSKFRLEIIGHSDQAGDTPLNRRLSLARANAVRSALLRLGLPASAMRVRGSPGPPPGLAAVSPDSLSRCVRFELERPGARQ